MAFSDKAAAADDWMVVTQIDNSAENGETDIASKSSGMTVVNNNHEIRRRMPQIDNSAKNDISSNETDTASNSSGMTVVNIKQETRRAMLKENEKIQWTQTRKILLGLLAQFVIAKGMPDHAATIARLEPIATSMNTQRKYSVRRIISRVYALQQKIIVGNTGKEQEEELGRLIADAIFSRKKDKDTKSVVERKMQAIRARRAADLLVSTSQVLEDKAKLLEEAASAAASLWLLSLLQNGLSVLHDM